MALTKKEMVSKIREETGLTFKEATKSFELLTDIIKSTLESGEDVMISGFGKFCVRRKNNRKGRNPATGDDMMLDRRNVVTFKCSSKLRSRMNGKKQ